MEKPIKPNKPVAPIRPTEPGGIADIEVQTYTGNCPLYLSALPGTLFYYDDFESYNHDHSECEDDWDHPSLQKLIALVPPGVKFEDVTVISWRPEGSDAPYGAIGITLQYKKTPEQMKKNLEQFQTALKEYEIRKSNYQQSCSVHQLEVKLYKEEMDKWKAFQAQQKADELASKLKK